MNFTLRLKEKDREMYLVVPEERMEGRIDSFVKEMTQEFFGPPLYPKMNSIDNTVTPSERLSSVSSDGDIFNIRQRLPNNVVDINQLSVKQAVTEKALIRCPACGQSHAVVVKDADKMYFMTRVYKPDCSQDEFNVAGYVHVEDKDKLAKLFFNGQSCDGDIPHKKLTYFYGLQKMESTDINFVVTNDAELLCPVCGKSSSFYSWKDAYENKERYFEYEYVCGVCGGECVMDAKEEKDDSNMVVCTKCGYKWEKERV